VKYSPIASDAAGVQPRLRACTFTEITGELVLRADHEARLIIAWSRREHDVLTSTVPELTRRLGMIMRDGNAPAKKWLRSMLPNVQLQAIPGVRKHRLKTYL
jgi:hypothetical protein